MKNADMPAMPIHEVFQDCGIDGNSGPHYMQTTYPGMTKREIIAMHCAAAAFGSPAWIDATNEVIARQAVEQADAMLAELEKQGGQQ